VATCLHTRNVPSLPGITSREVEAAWMHVKDMLVVLIDDTRAADESIRAHVTDDGESVDWLAAASLASSVLTTSRALTLPTKRSPCVALLLATRLMRARHISSIL